MPRRSRQPPEKQVIKIADLLNAKIACPPIDPDEPAIKELHHISDLAVRKDRVSSYERRVFRFLLSERTRLGIDKVIRFSNLLIDGALVLDDGRAVLMEIKYRVGWAKACQADWQLRTARRFPKVRKYQPWKGIVLFQEFSRDWARVSDGLPRGWRHWYRDYCGGPRSRDTWIALVQFKDGRLRRGTMS